MSTSGNHRRWHITCEDVGRLVQWVKGRLGMRRYQFLFILLCLSLVYLLIQFFMVLTVKQDEKLSSNVEVLTLFLEVCSQQGVIVTILEPEAVRTYLRGGVTEDVLYCETCNEFGRHHTTIGLESTDKISPDLFIMAGLRVHEVKVPDPRLESVTSLNTPNITTHYFIQRRIPSSHIIQVVFLYERKDDEESYFWHSDIRWDSDLPKWVTQSLQLEDLSFGTTSGVYQRLLTVNVKERGYNLKVPENLMTQTFDATFLDCNYTRAREFYKLYKQPTDNEFVKKAVTVMLKGREVLNKLEVPFWLSSGNCLGWFRQCGIIPYSQDIDFGVGIQDNDDRIIPAFQGAGFTLKHLFGKISDSYELSFVHVKTGIKLDLFFFYEEPDYLWNGGTEYDTGKKYKYIFPKFSLCWTELLQMKFRVPCETESYVEANYGKNWMKPVTSWDWKKSPPNVRENGVWPDDEWDKVIQIYDNVDQKDDIGLKLKG